jgi:cyclase
MIEVIKKTSERVFVPLTVGGGISTIEDARKVLKSGADKVSINTASIKNPFFINKFTRYFGSQACVIAIDAKRRPVYQKDKVKNKIIIDTPQGSFWYECSIYGGRKFTGIDAIQWAMEVESRGAGEILLTSMDKDGTKDGFDVPLAKMMCEKTDIPIIASGGCGKPEHIYEIFQKSNVSAALAASIFHYDNYGINRVKKYLINKGLKIRL